MHFLNGISSKDAITSWNGYVVDGHNRRNICLKHKLDCKIYQLDTAVYKTKNDVINWMIENQLGRRNLSLTEKYEIVQKYKTVIETKAKQNMSNAGKGLSTLSKVNTRKEMAKLVGTSEGTYSKLDKIYEANNSEVNEELKAGKISISKAYEKVSPKEMVQVSVDLSGVINTLKTAIEDAKDTSECDELLEQLKEHLQKIEIMKASLYRKRTELYENMPSDDIRCSYEEVDGNNIFNHK